MASSGPDRVFAALAHPVRRSLLDHLARGHQPVNRLARRYRMSRPAISQHLRVLLDAGLVEGIRDGRENNYELRAESLVEVSQWLRKYEVMWDQRLLRLGRYLDRKAASKDR